MSKTENKTMLTPRFRVSFPAIFEPKSFEGSEPAYEVTMLFDKKYLATDPEAKKLWQELLKEVKRVQDEAFKTGLPQGAKFCIKDGDKEKTDKDGYAGCYFIKAKANAAKVRPQVIYYETRQPVIDQAEIFPGCIMQASVRPFAYTKFGGGISMGLNNLMFYKKASEGVGSFSSRTNAESDFGSVAVTDVFDVPGEELGVDLMSMMK
jgi:hypothetical protein